LGAAAPASGAIDQSEFEQAIEVIGVPGIQKQQMAFLLKNIGADPGSRALPRQACRSLYLSRAFFLRGQMFYPCFYHEESLYKA